MSFGKKLAAGFEPQGAAHSSQKGDGQVPIVRPRAFLTGRNSSGEPGGRGTAKTRLLSAPLLKVFF